MAERVFVSYDHADADYASAVQTIVANYAFLNNNFRIQIDNTAIRPGANWRQEIERAIQSCNLFLAIVSQAHFSQYVVTEIGIAIGARKPILPLYIDSPAALTPYNLDHLQGAQFPAGDATMGAVTLLRLMVRALGTGKYNNIVRNVVQTFKMFGQLPPDYPEN